MSGDGIAVRTHVHSLLIKQNVIEQIGGGGIVMTDDSRADSLSIENNHLFDLVRLKTEGQREAAAIRVRNAGQAHVIGNVVKGVGQAVEGIELRLGIDVLAAATAHVAGNEVVDVGPAGSFVGFAVGIFVRAPVQRVPVIDNVIRRSAQPQEDMQSQWLAIAAPRDGDGVAGQCPTLHGARQYCHGAHHRQRNGSGRCLGPAERAFMKFLAF